MTHLKPRSRTVASNQHYLLIPLHCVATPQSVGLMSRYEAVRHSIRFDLRDFNRSTEVIQSGTHLWLSVGCCVASRMELNAEPS